AIAKSALDPVASDAESVSGVLPVLSMRTGSVLLVSSVMGPKSRTSDGSVIVGRDSVRMGRSPQLQPAVIVRIAAATQRRGRRTDERMTQNVSRSPTSARVFETP